MLVQSCSCSFGTTRKRVVVTRAGTDRATGDVYGNRQPAQSLAPVAIPGLRRFVFGNSRRGTAFLFPERQYDGSGEQGGTAEAPSQEGAGIAAAGPNLH